MNGVIYCRVSSKEQTEGTSLESQEAACREYAKSKNIKIEKVFVERGESAKFADRTQLLDLLEFVRIPKGHIQVLLVWKVDRFARNVTDHFNIKATLLKYGVRVLSVTEPIDANPEGKLMETILAGFAQFDNDIRATRTVQGMRRRIQEGISPWEPPLGYRSSGTKGEKKTTAAVPEQPIFSLIQKAWKEAATGAHTKAGMQRLMAAWGIGTKKGAPLSAQFIDKFFCNPFYAGVLVDPWSGEKHAGQHVPAVTEQDFLRVQQVFAARSRSIPRQRMRPEFPLRGLVRCGECRWYLTGSLSRGRLARYAYYHCHNRRCPNGRSLPVAPIHEEFESFLEDIAPEHELLDRFGAVIFKVAEERRSRRAKVRAQRTNVIRRLKKESEELIRMRAQGLITDEEFIGHKAMLRESEISLVAEARNADENVQDLSRELGEIKGPLHELPATWRALAPGKRRRFERMVLPGGFVNGKVRTADLGLLFSAFGQSARGESTAVALGGNSWNQIVAEIRAFAGLFRPGDDDEEAPKRPVRTKPRIVPSGENLEPGVAA